MAGNGDDALLDQSVATTWDEEEWEWELCVNDKPAPAYFDAI